MIKKVDLNHVLTAPGLFNAFNELKRRSFKIKDPVKGQYLNFLMNEIYAGLTKITDLEILTVTMSNKINSLENENKQLKRILSRFQNISALQKKLEQDVNQHFECYKENISEL